METSATEEKKPEAPPIKRHWLKMGVELEGAWDNSYVDVAATVPGAQGKRDGSVGDGGRLPGVSGEITTRPHEDIDKLCEDTVKLWPQYVNHTCGFHIHTSFNELNTSVLADKPFWNYFLARWEAWGKAHEKKMTNDERNWFWDRLEAKSEKARRYCKREFIPDRQFEHHEERYTSINFTAWHKFKTIEVRFLPMFKKPELAISAIHELASIFDTFLTQNSFPVIKEESEPLFVGDMVVEVQELEMPELSYFEQELPCASNLPEVAVGPDIFYRFKQAKGLLSLPGEELEELQEP